MSVIYRKKSLFRPPMVLGSGEKWSNLRDGLFCE